MLFQMPHVKALIDCLIFRGLAKLAHNSITVLISSIDILAEWRSLVDSQRLEHSFSLFSENRVADEHELLAATDLVTSLESSFGGILLFAVTAAAIEHHVVKFECEEMLPQLQVLPMCII